VVRDSFGWECEGSRREDEQVVPLKHMSGFIWAIWSDCITEVGNAWDKDF
jgi:hypothetical protein